jgi:hypothetical protein
MNPRPHHLIARVLVFLWAGIPATVRAQSMGEVLATWSGGSLDYETLSKTNDGLLIFQRSGRQGDPDFYVRETVSLRAIDSITMQLDTEELNDVFIEVFATEGAVLREHHTGDTRTTRHNSEAMWVFPISEKTLADSVLRKLKALTGK